MRAAEESAESDEEPLVRPNPFLKPTPKAASVGANPVESPTGAVKSSAPPTTIQQALSSAASSTSVAPTALYLHCTGV